MVVHTGLESNAAVMLSLGIDALVGTTLWHDKMDGRISEDGVGVEYRPTDRRLALSWPSR